MPALFLITAAGSPRLLSRGDPDVAGAVVGPGTLGVVTSRSLDLVPTFDVARTASDAVPVDRSLADLDAIGGRTDSGGGFTDWHRDRFTQVWVKAIAGRRPPDLRQLGVRGPWHERLPHFRAGSTPSSGHELRTEYLDPRCHAADALAAVAALRDAIGPALQVSEFRLVAADELWLSPAAVLPRLEAALAPIDARPHWGKGFVAGGPLAGHRQPPGADFVQSTRRLDPTGKFAAAYVA